jgi:hypothetical protein
MNLGKPTGGARGAPIEDPAQIRQAMQALHQSEAEFPIKVEGTHTLPYTAHVLRIDEKKGLLYLKLIRPLPHELLTGAIFEMLFAVGDQRLEGIITFLGREAYLLYKFTLPSRMAQTDRRAHKRYPFRPREKAYVLGQDAGLPGHGLAGPLVNLSLGGLAFRVDRVMRLGDNLRVTPGVGFFERGKTLPILKVRDLPKHPLLELHGLVANAWERETEIVVGVQFYDLKDAELKMLQEVLLIREQMQKSSSPLAPGAAAHGARAKAAPEELRGPATAVNPAGTRSPDALTRLGRRSTGIVLAMPEGAARDELSAALEGEGYFRLVAVATLEQALDRLRADQATLSRVLVLEVPLASEPPLTGIRALQRELGVLKELPVALVSPLGQPRETEDPLIRPIPWPSQANGDWLPLLDELAGL